MVSTGAKQALMNAFLTILDPGDVAAAVPGDLTSGGAVCRFQRRTPIAPVMTVRASGAIVCLRNARPIAAEAARFVPRLSIQRVTWAARRGASRIPTIGGGGIACPSASRPSRSRFGAPLTT